ncbi:50S ribosomal protein L18 [bacterium]|nr:MAG: 50S ribosomal protein L18 [bacterium]
MLNKRAKRRKRIYRIRKKVSGTPDKPRLVVYRSLRHIYAQLVDDTQGRTLTTVSTLSPEIRDEIKGKRKIEQSAIVGKLIAEKAKSLDIENVVFDRRGFKYHGRVKALADAARENGLKF